MKKISINDLIIKLDEYDYKEFHVHHTWKPNHGNFTGDNHLKLQNGMKNYHVNHNGWADIAQHISVFPDGVIVTGRDFEDTPVSIRGHNTGAFAMEMIGDFDLGKDRLKDEQLKMVMQITNYFIKRNIKVVFHNEYSYKTCPGSGIKKETFVKVAKEINNISDWALNSWWKSVDKDINDGKGPKNNITEEQLMVFYDKLGLLD